MAWSGYISDLVAVGGFGLGGAEAALEDAAAARTAAASPPALVPMSEWTAISGHPMLVLAQPDITDTDRAVVSIAVGAVANLFRPV